MASVAPTFSDLSNSTITVNLAGGAEGFLAAANLTALSGLPSLSTNQVAFVHDDGTGAMRIYNWNNDSTDTADGYAIVASTDGGQGRWFLQY
jgi:hypothetical protein